MIVACPYCSGFDRFIGKKSLVLHCRELFVCEMGCVCACEEAS